MKFCYISENSFIDKFQVVGNGGLEIDGVSEIPGHVFLLSFNMLQSCNNNSKGDITQ